MTLEERRTRQKAAQQVYRDNLTPERRATIAEQKRAHNAANKERNAEKRRLYYEANKEHMQANSKAYHQKMREETRAKKESGVEINGVTYAVRIRDRKKKVVNQPANTIILKEIAKLVGMLTPQFRALTLEAKYKFPAPTMVRIDGMDLYDVFEVTEWTHLHKEALTNASILGARRKSANGFKLSKNVMLLINWMQKTKHISKYCNKQRLEVASNKYWGEV